ncbi:AI-2E family transporter [Erythrobacteraceae bacterium WH01K]|nr:AI-2E family transporter [Erythrobacteraceae bacterium WH01K]
MSEAGPDTDDKGPETHGSSPAFILDPRLRHEANRAFVWVTVIGLVALAVYISQSLLVIFGALVFASMIDGGSRLLGRVLPIGRRWRVSLVLIGVVAFFYWLVTFAGAQITQQAAELPSIVERQGTLIEQWAEANGVSISLSQLQSMSSQVLSGVGTVTKALTGLAGGVATAILIVIIGIYVAFEPRLYERGVEWFAPRSSRQSFSVTLDRMAHTLRRLMAGRLLGMVFEGFVTFLALTMLDVPMAALLGILTGLLAFIPNIGAPISGLLMAMVGFSVDAETGLYTIGIYFFVQTFDGYVVIPMIAKKTVDLAPALVLAAQLILGILFGILGLLLADPLMAMLKVALERRAEQNDEAIQSQANGDGVATTQTGT